MRRGLLLLVGLAWTAFSFWLFGFSFSSSFFHYNQHSRLPIFAAAVFGSVAMLVSAWVQSRSQGSALGACVRHAVGVGVAFGPFLIVAEVLRRAPSPWRPSADDAMGIGIDFMFLSGLAVASFMLLAGALVGRRLRRRGS